jgi:phosphate transport system protein
MMDERVSASDWDAERVTLGKHFLRDLESLWTQVLKLAAVVEEALNTSVRALCDGRADLAAGVKLGEQIIDRWEVQLERDCLRVLALHQPVASDLRRIAVVLRINGDLERMADLARHIARRAKKIASSPTPMAIPEDLEAMAVESLAQVRDSLDALIKGDVTLARAVIHGDRRIDRHHRLVRKNLKAAIRRDPDRLNTWLRLINTARNLERVADHATNIAEAVLYLKEGDIVRHSPRTDAGLTSHN